MTKLCLVRHGQTDWNLEGRYQGQSDVPLNENGRAQALEIAHQLRRHPLAAIYSSDLLRAFETAKIIATVTQLPVTTDNRLREINQGEWEGQLVEIIRARYSEIWEQRITDPATVRPPGGETIGEVAARVYAALDDIARLFNTDSVLVVSHGLSLATVICQARGIPISQAYQMIPNNAELIWADWPD